MIWGYITWYGVGTLCKVDGNINAVKYRDILDNHPWPVLARHFADKTYRFQDDNVPVHRARIIAMKFVPAMIWLKHVLLGIKQQSLTHSFLVW
jgi:hypothetical protein